MSIIQIVNKASNVYHRLKTILYYRPMFRGIGNGSTLRTPLLLNNPQCIQIGDHVLIREGARLEVLKTDGVIASLTVGNNTNIEQNVHIICRNRVQIGANVSITGNCSIVDVTHPYEDIHDPRKIGERILDQPSFVEIGDGCFIGMGSVILPNIRLGKYVIVGANSVVSKDLPDYCVAAGAPAKILRRYDHVEERWLKIAEDSN